MRNVLVEQLHLTVAIFTSVHDRFFFWDYIRNRSLDPAKSVTIINLELSLYFDGVDFVCHRKRCLLHEAARIFLSRPAYRQAIDLDGRNAYAYGHCLSIFAAGAYAFV